MSNKLNLKAKKLKKLNPLHSKTKKKEKHQNQESRIFGISEITEEAFYFLECCCSFVEHNGIRDEGIYRVNGSSTSIAALRESFESRPFETIIEPPTTVFDVCGCLKLFFREMTIPLMTFEYYDAFIAAAVSLESVEDYNISLVSKLVSMLPEKNKRILFRLMKHFQLVSEQSQYNMMTCSNLAIVFAPSLLFTESDDPVVIMGDSKYANLLITKMIENPDIFFFFEEEKRTLTNSSESNSTRSLPNVPTARKELPPVPNQKKKELPSPPVKKRTFHSSNPFANPRDDTVSL
eukprot:TRINITY_DN5350_c0_g1_i2.p1 TRINITY_DN5350_c0_g1~~TRINITY_DN5350_c0_g1_i2.p1  ORF type:complete len:292 (+),score=68.29 TRINITY_DN5350_c0_g1_i2:17-892(+)